MDLFNLYARISLDSSDYETGIEKASKSGESLASKLKSGLSTAGSIAAKGIGVIAGAATAAGGALLALEGVTEEYRVAQGKLNTAFEAAGYSAEAAQEAYTGFYGILGDTDTATEASQLLAKLADSEEDLSEWTNIAAGVYGTFGDSLPIEGLIEAANETVKVGQVTGTLADALNWAGISEDDFNAKLAACSSETERNQLVMETLSGTYDEAADIFYKNNEALVEARLNQAKLTESLAELGQTVTDIKNKILAEFIPSISGIVSAFNDMLNGVEGAGENFGTTIQSFIENIVEKLPDFLSMGVDILTALITGILQAVPSLIEAVPTILGELVSALSSALPQILSAGGQVLQKLADGIKNGLPKLSKIIPEIIVNFVDFLTESLPNVLEQGVQIINYLAEGIVEAIPILVEKLPDVITSIVNFVAQNLPKIIQAGIDILISLITGIITAIPELIAALPEIITAIAEGLISLAGALVEVGKVIISKIWEGIEFAFPEFAAAMEEIFTTVWEVIKKVWDAVEPYFSALWEAIKLIFSVVVDVLGGFFSLAWDAIKLVWDTATGFFDNIWETIKGIFSVVENVLSGNFSEAWEAIKDVFSGWGEFFSDLWEQVKEIFSGVWEWFSGIGEDIVNGIKEGISSVWDGLTESVSSHFDDLYEDVKANEEIHSPSKKWARIGQADAMGYNQGWGDEFSSLQSSILSGFNQSTVSPSVPSSYLGGYQVLSQASSTPSSVNITLELDGAVLARKMYTYNQKENKRRGVSLVNA